jgi:hypothetical protein
MADNTNTMAGLLALNDRNLSGVEASSILQSAPVVAALFAQKASQGGTTHKFQRDATAPGVGFRLINEGITNDTGTFDIVTLTCALLDGSFSRDKAVALGYMGGPTQYMDKEGVKSLRAALFALERALFQSSQNKQFTSLAGNTFFDAITVDAQVVNAGGSGGKSVWLLRSAEDGISIIAGNDGRIDMSEEDATVVLQDSSNRPYTALHRSLMGWFNVQVGCQYDAARIANLDGTTGHTLTDTLIAQAAIKAKTGMPFNMIAMSKTSLYELWASRTATNPTGKEAEWPTGIMMPNGQVAPILVTDGISEAEAALNTTTTTTTTSTQA